MQNEFDEAIQRALSRLSYRDRYLLVMRFREQFTFEEMGRRLGYSPVAARKALLKAVERLRKQIDFEGLGD